jgi:Cys/Met metabolism PLP-dependent enzyme
VARSNHGNAAYETRVFLETPSNPMIEVFDIAAIAEMCRKVGATFVVDNCFCTRILQKPLALGADVVIHSASKHLDGQGRVMGGAIVGTSRCAKKPFTTICVPRALRWRRLTRGFCSKAWKHCRFACVRIARTRYALQNGSLINQKYAK